MARTSNLTQIITWAQQLANMENSTFVGWSEWTDLANRHKTEVFDMLVEAGPPDYYSNSVSFTTNSGQITYNLVGNVGISDFRSLVQVYAQEDTDYFRPLLPVTDVERVRWRAPQGSYTVVLRYIPAPTSMTNNSDTFDGVSGWEELVVAMMARDALMKEESPIDSVQLKIQMLQERIRNQASRRHQGMPPYVTDVDAITQWPYPYRVALNGYQLRGDAIDLYSLHPVFP